MFERFTNQSRRVVVLAQEEARLLDHNYIGTEHLLLGLLHEGRGPAARVLAAMDVTLVAARDQVVAIVGRGQQQPSGHIPFTPGAKKSLELSLREALQLGDGYIGTGHLLLGLIRQGDNMAVKVLGELGTDLNDLRARVTQGMRDHPEEGQDAPAVERQPQPKVFLRDTVQGLLDTIDDRLSAIERHLGITRPVPAALRTLDQRIADIRRDKQAAIDVQDFERAVALRDAEKQLIEERARTEQEIAAAGATARDAEAATGAETGDAGTDSEGLTSHAPAGEGPVDATDAAGEAVAAGETDATREMEATREVVAAGETGEVGGEPDEVTRLLSWVAHLEGRLREHGIDPEEPQEPPAAAG